MSRIAVIGLTAGILTACGPADQTPAAGSAAPTPAQAVTPAAEPPAAPVSAPRPAEPMSWEALQDRYQPMEVEPTDPLEALGYRAVICAHLVGEVGSGDPERERYLGAQIDKYRCEELPAEVRAMRDARSDEPSVVARLDTILAGLPY